MLHSSHVAPKQLIGWTRTALNQLYDSPSLSGHPLAQLLREGQDQPVDAGQYLRRVILDCIETLQPKKGTPSESPDWRIYRILEARYIACMSLEEAMRELGLQKSQFYHYQRKAWDALAAQIAKLLVSDQGTETTAVSSSGSKGLVDAAAHSLVESAQTEDVDLDQLLQAVHVLLAPLALKKSQSLVLGNRAPGTMLNVSRIPIRQALLNAVTYALGMGRGHEVCVGVTKGIAAVGFRVRVGDSADDLSGEDVSDGDYNRFQLCKMLVADSGGTVSLLETDTGAIIDLIWAIEPKRTLLVIDDNAGFSALYSRYLVDRGWRVAGARNGSEARAFLAREKPTLILLDVLMPDEDGWEFLTFLKAEPTTCAIPTIVCSVLDESELAHSLGAESYLLKPVTESSLLSALGPYGSQ